MSRFNINIYNQDKYEEVSFENGLDYISDHLGSKLYSDGLEFDEYMIFVKDHYEYEDGCYLGTYDDEIILRTGGLNSWIPSYKFYIEKESEVKKWYE